MTMVDVFDEHDPDFIRKLEESVEAWASNQGPIGGNCFYCGKFTPHDKGLNLRYIGGHGNVYVCEECQQ